MSITEARQRCSAALPMGYVIHKVASLPAAVLQPDSQSDLAADGLPMGEINVNSGHPAHRGVVLHATEVVLRRGSHSAQRVAVNSLAEGLRVSRGHSRDDRLNDM